MRESTLRDIICPYCVEQAAGEFALQLHERVPIVAVQLEQERELLEAVLVCARCQREFPILAGVLLAVPDVDSYLRRQYHALLGIVSEYGGVSADMQAYLRQKGYHLAKAENREYYDSPRKLSTYLCAHYDDLAALVSSEHSFGRYLQSAYQNFYTTVLSAYRERAGTPVRSGTRPALALDVGAYVGGAVARLAPDYERVYGIDLSFAGILLARCIHLGQPGEKTHYRLFLDGQRALEREISPALARASNVEMLVASGLSLPFRAATFRLTTNFNLLELVERPLTLLRELRRVAAASGHILVSTPYWWEEDEAPVENWLGGQETCSSSAALREIFYGMGVVPFYENLELPWILRYNSRAFMTFVNDVFIGVVQAER